MDLNLPLPPLALSDDLLDLDLLLFFGGDLEPLLLAPDLDLAILPLLLLLLPALRAGEAGELLSAWLKTKLYVLPLKVSWHAYFSVKSMHPYCLPADLLPVSLRKAW